MKKFYRFVLMLVLMVTGTAVPSVAQNAADDYFTMVIFSDSHINQDDGTPQANMQKYATAMVNMGKTNGLQFRFNNAPAGFVPKTDIAFFLGDMDADSQTSHSAFSTGVSALKSASFPFLVVGGNHDFVPDYWGQATNPDVGLTYAGWGANNTTLSTVDSYWNTAKGKGITDYSRITDNTDHNQTQPMVFKFGDVRFYLAQTYWFQKPWGARKLLDNSDVFWSDGVINELQSYVNNHQNEAAIWLQHYPFNSGASDDKRWWTDQTSYGYIRKPSGTSPYYPSDDVTEIANVRRDKMIDLMYKTKGRAHFSGHNHNYHSNAYTKSTDAAMSITDYVVAETDKSGSLGNAYIVLVKKGEGVKEVKQVSFNTYTVSVSAPSGFPGNGGIRIVDGGENVYLGNGDVMSKGSAPVAGTDFFVRRVNGYNATATVSGNTITVTYTAQQSSTTLKAQLLSYSDISGMSNGSSKRVLIGNPQKNNGYFFGYNGTSKVSSTFGATMAAALTNANNLANNATYQLTLAKNNNGKYVISHTGSSTVYLNNSVGFGASEFGWTGLSVSSLASTTDMTANYALSNLIRFSSTGTKSYFNSQGNINNWGLRDGEGEWSVWCVYELVEETVTPNTYNIVVTGNNDGRVIYNGVEYANGTSFSDTELEQAVLSAKKIDGYRYTLTVSGTTITAAYEEIPPYPINFSADQKYPASERHINSVCLTTAAGTQTVAVPNTGTWTTTKCYQYVTGDDVTKKFTVTAGENITPSFNWSGAWMKGVVYLDAERDSSFVGDAITVTGESALRLDQSPVFPTIKAPSTPGTYRMRYMVDWNCTDPGGYPGDNGDPVNGNNGIIKNSGSITDIDLVVEASQVKTYTVHVSGCDDGRLVYDGQEYEDGDQIEVILDQEKLSAKTVTGYVGHVRIGGASGTDLYAEYGKDYSFTPATYFTGDKAYVNAIGEARTGAIEASEDQWYLLKQSRGAISPAYDDNGAVKRAQSDGVVNVNGATSSENVYKYLVRLVPSNEIQGAFYIQFGTGKFMGSPNSASGSNGGGNVMTSTTPGSYRVYTATQSTAGWTAPYAINYTTSEVEYGWKVDNNSNGGTVSYWNSGQTTSGTNNIWALYPVTLGSAMVVDVSALQTAINTATPYASCLGSGLNQYTEATSGTLASALSAANTVLADANKTQAQVNTATTNLNNAVSALTFNLPADGTFLRIKGDASSKYIAAGMASNNKYNMTAATDESTLFFYKDGKLRNIYSGKYNGMTSSSWAWQDDATNASTMTFAQGNTVGFYTVKSTNAYFYDNGNGNPSSTDRGGSLGTDARYHKWILEAVTPADVTINISSVGRGTFASEYPLDFSQASGITAYICTGTDDANDRPTHLVMAEVEGAVEAGTGLYVAGEEGEYSIPVYTGSTFPEIPGDRRLKPVLPRDITSGTKLTIYQIDGDNTNYILQNQTKGLKFYKVKTQADGGNTVIAHRAYLQLPTPQAGAKEWLDLDLDDATGISDIANAKANANAAYDLSGRKVGADYKGIVIVNGRKEIRK